MNVTESAPENSSETLERLLDQLIANPSRQAEITRRIERIFGEDRAVLVLDMSGFCRTAREHDIVLVLSKIHQMRGLLKPCIEQAGGKLIKAEADNLFCLFESVEDALSACGRIQKCLAEANRELAEHCRINIAAGIGYGHILNIGNRDLFGDEVNLASKLGEDIAAEGEILLTENACAQIPEAEKEFEKKSARISGFDLVYRVGK